MTKPVTAEAVLRLAAAGETGLDRPMARRWIDPDIAGDPRRWRLTPRLALSHQTGFANWRSATGGRLTFAHAPGKGIGYSGEGYEYLARFIARETGETIDAIAHRLVFDPIGMRETSYTGRTWFAGRIAQPSREGTWLEPAIADKAIASDQLYTTARDYAAFLASLIRGDGLTGALIEQRSRVAADQTALLCKTPDKRLCPSRAGFGLGWQVFQFGSRRFLMHTGSDEGEFAFTYWSPNTREGAVFLTNSSAGGAALLDLLDLLEIDTRFLAYLRSQTAG